MNDAIKMQISAFVDSELPENEGQMLLRRLSQDFELRQQAAEYLAIGRALCGHRNVAGIDKLRERIAASIDDKSLHEDFEVVEMRGRRYLRPLAGVAIAATVAIAAIFGLQQVSVVPEPGDLPNGEQLAGDVAESIYTVPEQPSDQVLQYHLRHNADFSASGTNNINARLATAQLLEEVIVEPDDDAMPVPNNDSLPVKSQP